MSRILVAWCPDWSVTAALAEAAEDGGDRLSSRSPAAVLSGNIVQVCNQAARDEGVRRGQRRRDAQARCPEVVLLKADPERDARWFEPVLEVVEAQRPGVAPVRPGLLAVRAAGRFGAGAAEDEGAAQLAEMFVAAGVWDCRFGVADDLYTAERAAREAPVQGCVVVRRGGSAAFLRDLPLTVLADDGEEGRELADLLRRLGLSRLGELADLGADEVSNRFGAYGTDLWHRVHGQGRRQVAGREPPPELAREIGFEPPLESAEAVTFSVRTTAESFIAGLAERQLVATSVRVEAELEDTGVTGRTWLHPRCFTSRDLVDRVHWQLQAGLATSGLRSRKDAGAVTSPVTLVRFVPETVEPAGDHAEGLWGGGVEEQVLRGVARIQAMVGYDAVRVPVLQGGRGAADRQAMVPWGTTARGLRRSDEPWPGAIPGPAPSRVFASPLGAEVVDLGGRVVTVTDRGLVSCAPARLLIAPERRGAHWCAVAAWAGPWPVEERWWVDPSAGRQVRFQLVGVDGRAWLARWSPEGWSVEAAYD